MMNTRRWFLLAAGCLFWALPGCVNIQAPEKIEVRGSSRPEPVDSSRVPRTASHEEARGELRKAYANLQYLERENGRLQRKADEYKRKRDKCRKELDRCEDRLEDYEDD